MIVCPNTSPLIVLARLERLDLLGDPADIRVTRAVQDEIRDKQDEVADRVAKLTAAMPPIVDLCSVYALPEQRKAALRRPGCRTSSSRQTSRPERARGLRMRHFEAGHEHSAMRPALELFGGNPL